MFAALLGATKHENRGVAEERGWYCRGWVSGVSVDFRIDSRPASVCRGDAVCLRGRRSSRRPSYFWASDCGAKIRWPAMTSALHTQRPATAATSGTSSPLSSSGSLSSTGTNQEAAERPIKKSSQHRTFKFRELLCWGG